MASKGYRFTESEDEEASRAGLAAAWHALQALKDEEIGRASGALVCIRAFHAARVAIRASVEETLKKHPEAEFADYSEDRDVTHPVCSAFMGLDMQSADDIHPQSVMGERLMMFSKAVAALGALSHAELEIGDDEPFMGASHAGGALKLYDSPNEPQ